jgi:uncharacterized protein
MTEFRLTSDDQIEHLRGRARELFLPSRPITLREALRGRTRQLERTLETLQTPGRSVFVFGERGVGKTSLAQTAAFLFNSSEVDPVFLACHRRSSFAEIVAQIVRKLAAFGRMPSMRTVTAEGKVSLGSLAEIVTTIEEKPLEALSGIDPNLAVDLFNAVCPTRLSGRVVVLLDEIDTIQDEKTQGDLAYLIKQIGDRECKIKFIFAGIGESIDTLLREHESASRYIATIKLDRLSLSDLREIVTTGFGELGLEISDPFSWRVVCISDGFAHFTHLLGLKLALRVIDEETGRVDARTFADAINDAVEDSEGWLKQSYDRAVQKYRDVYEPVLWAVADHWELLRSTDQIYQSYTRICADVGRPPEDKRPAFYNRLYSLRQPTHGAVLHSPRKSWYQFTQNMLRGYCRLVAEAQRVEIGKDYLGGANSRRST